MIHTIIKKITCNQNEEEKCSNYIIEKIQEIDIDCVWILTSNNSEVILDVKVIIEGVAGLTKRPSKTTVWLLPLVTLLLSGGALAIIKIPPAEFSNVKEP